MLGEPKTSGDSIDRERGSCIASVPLDRLLATAALDPAALDPAQVRVVILTEHQKIRAQLARLETDAMALLACSVAKSTTRHALRQQALSLCDQMGAHIAFENKVLVPVVRLGDAWGPLRAQKILEEHSDQLQLLRAYADLLMGECESNPAVAVTVWQLVQSIGRDMREEEAQVLSPEFLSDRIGQSVETG